jgi:hypothetical protein
MPFNASLKPWNGGARMPWSRYRDVEAGRVEAARRNTRCTCKINLRLSLLNQPMYKARDDTLVLMVLSSRRTWLARSNHVSAQGQPGHERDLTSQVVSRTPSFTGVGAEA